MVVFGGLQVQMEEAEEVVLDILAPLVQHQPQDLLVQDHLSLAPLVQHQLPQVLQDLLVRHQLSLDLLAEQGQLDLRAQHQQLQGLLVRKALLALLELDQPARPALLPMLLGQLEPQEPLAPQERRARLDRESRQVVQRAMYSLRILELTMTQSGQHLLVGP